MLLCSSRSSILVNGTEGEEIKHARGLRQGDPLSPYLFILAIDALQKVLELATNDGVISPLRGRCAKIRLSLYADDAVIFLNPNREEVASLLNILTHFGATTGLRLNWTKCSVAPIRCAGINLDQVLEPFAGLKVHFPITYLGLPLTLGRLKIVHLQGILDKARKKLAGWQGRLLNPAGRRELVRSVLSAIPIYMLTSLKAPKQLLQDLDKLRRRFLWAGDGEITGGKCKVAWPLVARPIRHGGLGIIDMERFSRALRLRWLWLTWSSTDRPWTGMQLPVDEKDIALFSAATKVTIGNGRRAPFWTSCWIRGRSPASLFPSLYTHVKRKKRTVREAVFDGKLIQDIAHNLNAEILRDFVELWKLIHTLHLDQSCEQEDTIVWTLESSGEYSAKSAYEIQFCGQTFSNFPKLIWKAWATPRIKFFLWLLLQDRVWTAARLQLRGWENNYFMLCVKGIWRLPSIYSRNARLREKSG